MTNATRSLLIATSALLGTLSAFGAARADTPPTIATGITVPQERPWAVSGQMTFFVNGMPSYGSIGLNVERVLTRYLRVDADIGRGLSSTVATTGGDLHLEPALDLGARARATLPFGFRDRHAVFLGAGPHFSTGGAYDNLWQGRLEVGYAFRAAGGFSFLYAIGTELVLADRPEAVVSQGCTTSSCPSPLHAGDATTVVRGALGYAF
jgi:hypothetical protein